MSFLVVDISFNILVTMGQYVVRSPYIFSSKLGVPGILLKFDLDPLFFEKEFWLCSW